ncbi:hypothetical protein GCM10027425_20830 [Alteromonas gracilis]
MASKHGEPVSGWDPRQQTAVQTNARRRHTTVATTTDALGRQATTERTTESDGPTPPAI